jgi:hypothetical protein
MTLTCRRFARAYRRGGWSIFPVLSDKRPAVAWKTYQTNLAQLEQVDAWWPDDDPNRFGIGLVCGNVSGIVVLDADGPMAVKALRKMVGPDAWMARSGSGGLHAYFRYEDERRQIGILKFTDRSHIDLLGEGGYVILPPSPHPSGDRYQWLRIVTTNLPPVPAWAKTERHPIVVLPTGNKPSRSNKGRVLFGGERHEGLLRIAGGMHRRGCDATDIANELRRVNATDCIPPMSEEELHRDIDGIVSSLPRWSS